VVKDLLDAAYVMRFHTGRDKQQYQTIGEHSFGVALIICQLHPNPSPELLKAAIYHDLSEKILGDVPSPAKWRYEQFGREYEKAEKLVNLQLGIRVDLTPKEQVWLACADMMELLIYSDYRSQLKNSNNEWAAIVDTCIKWYEARVESLPREVREELEKCEYLVAESTPPT
jgi:HD containing hydrolase-like enzyme